MDAIKESTRTRADCQPDAAVVDPAPSNPRTAIVRTGHDTHSASEPSSIGTRVEPKPDTGVAAFPNADLPPDPSPPTTTRVGRDPDVDVSASPSPSTPGAYDGCYKMQ